MSILKNTMLTALTATIVLGGAAASFADDKKGGKRGERGARINFEEIDANSDGKLDFAEFSAPMVTRFETADADSNGTITEAEIETARENNGGRGDRKGRFIKRVDVDENGEITKAELEVHSQKMFDRIDADKDGFATQEELKEMRANFRGGDRKKGKRG